MPSLFRQGASRFLGHQVSSDPPKQVARLGAMDGRAWKDGGRMGRKRSAHFKPGNRVNKLSAAGMRGARRRSPTRVRAAARRPSARQRRSSKALPRGWAYPSPTPAAAISRVRIPATWVGTASIDRTARSAAGHRSATSAQSSIASCPQPESASAVARARARVRGFWELVHGRGASRRARSSSLGRRAISAGAGHWGRRQVPSGTASRLAADCSQSASRAALTAAGVSCRLPKSLGPGVPSPPGRYGYALTPTMSPCRAGDIETTLQ
jgi:hypothetical protein